MANSNAFSESRNLFILATQYIRPLSYEEWKLLPRDHMSAVLFVQFYESITQAWYKVKSFYAEEERGVSTICQYLEKNVPLILEERTKFSPNYIYRVAFNCLYCICHDIKIDKDRWENETPSTVITDDGEVDIRDTMQTESTEDRYFSNKSAKKIWDIINNSDLETQKVVRHLIEGTPLTKVRASKSNPASPLNSIEVSVEQLEEIIAELRIKLWEFKSEYEF